MNFHKRLLITVFMPVLVLFVVAALVLLNFLSKHNQAHFFEVAKLHSDRNAQLFHYAWPVPPEQLNQLLTDSLDRSSIKSITLLNDQALPIAIGDRPIHQGMSLPLAIDRLKLPSKGVITWITDQGSELMILRPLSLISGDEPLWLLMAYDRQGLQLRQQQTVAYIFIVFLALSGLLYAVLHRLIQTYSRPIEAIFFASRFYDENQLEYLLDVRSDVPEFVVLQNIINTLNTNMRQQQHDIDAMLQETTYDLRGQVESYESLTIKLQSTLREARDADRIKTQFLAQMSHDMRTPLHSIIGFSTVLSEHLSSDKDREYLGRISDSATILASLLNNILDYSRLNAGKLELILSKTTLSHALEDILAQLSSQANNKHLLLSYTLDPQLPHCFHMDHMKLKQILMNLVGNAIKFSDRGRVHIDVSGEVTSQLSQRDSNTLFYRLAFSVIDQGMGISHQHQQRLFVPYSQLQQGRNQQQGSGLGLSISHRLVELMQGSIDVSSLPGQGSTFSFSILAEAIDDQPAADESHNETLLVRLNDDHYYATVENLAQRLNIPVQRMADSALASVTDQQRLLYFLNPDEMASPPWPLLAQLVAQLRVHLLTPWHLEAIVDRTESLGLPTLTLPLLSRHLLNFSCQRDKLARLSEHKTVLVVDDNENNRRMLEVMMEPLPLTVILASSGEEALALLSKRPVDMVFMDIQMPGLNGIDTMRAIREQKQYRHLAIVAVTAQQEEHYAEQLKERGFDDFMPKPHTLQDVELQLSRWLSFVREAEPEPSRGPDLGQRAAASSDINDIDSINDIDGIDCVFDPQRTLARFNYRVDVCEEMMERLFNTLAQTQPKLREEQPNAELAATLHWLKGGTKMLGVNALNAQVELCEKAAKFNASELPTLMAMLMDDIDNVLALQQQDWRAQLRQSADND